MLSQCPLILLTISGMLLNTLNYQVLAGYFGVDFTPSMLSATRFRFIVI